MSPPGPTAIAGNSTLPAVPGRILDADGSGTRVVLLQNGTVTARPEGAAPGRARSGHG
jgi:hypothetical protein